MIDIAILHARQLKDLREYFYSKNTSLHSAIVLADKEYTPLNLSNKQQTYNAHTLQQKIDEWKQKTLHGKHPYNINKEHISKADSYKWLQKGELYPETEGFTLAIQDQVIATKNYLKYIVKDTNIKDDKCRRCHMFPETIDHITAGCKLLAGTVYTNRHNTAAKIIHQQLALQHKLITETQPYYTYTPQTILENDKYKLYWDITLHTDKTVMHNRPDITLQNKTEEITYLIDIAVPSDHNINNKYLEKKDKYQPLAIELERIWKQKHVKVIPFIISVTGITPKTFITHLTQLNLPHNIHTQVQKAIILQTCNITRSFLNQK